MVGPNLKPKKRSLTLHAHRTSVSLEDPFWDAFVQIAKAKDKTINQLAKEIDVRRDYSAGLASAIRHFVLQHYQNVASAEDISHPENEQSGERLE